MNFLNPFQMTYMIIITLLLINDFFPVSFPSHKFHPRYFLEL
ncbi:hypothetical protein SRABI133_02765 [Peribacillus simplex]|uniref:Uncharacterized protein n=1 Tax=Peribacillus simplex TaxID=1478 RepID=A0A9W4L3E6_9BACI|nr:hypothetical protein SRABI133_02765 [Peribacillus simplex]